MLVHRGRKRRLPLPRGASSFAERFGPLVRSDLALRLASNKVKFNLEIPELSSDPWESYLVKEAILTRYHTDLEERQREQREEEAFAEARQRNEEWRKNYLAEKGLR